MSRSENLPLTEELETEAERLSKMGSYRQGMMTVLPYEAIESGPCTRCGGISFWRPKEGGWNRCLHCDPPKEQEVLKI